MHARAFARGLSLSALGVILAASATGGAAINTGAGPINTGGAGTIGTIGGTIGGGGGPITPTCATPALSDCHNPTYRSSTCGQQTVSTCNSLLTTDYQNQYAASTADQTPVLLPDELAGAGMLQTAKVVKDIAAPSIAKYSASTLTLQNKLAMATANIARVPGDTTPQHPDWEANSSVQSCDEYAYEASYDYSRFADAASTCGDDYNCIYNVAAATVTPGINKPTLLKKNGTAAADQIRAQPGTGIITKGGGTHVFYMARPKNPFFSYDPAFLKTLPSYASDAAFKAKADAIIANQAATPSYFVGDELSWQMSMHDAIAPLALTAAETKSIDKRRETYAAGVARVQQLTQTVATMQAAVNAAGNSWFGQINLPFMQIQLASAKSALTASQDALRVMLFAEWDHKSVNDGTTADQGCLSGGSKKCDWTAKTFTRTFANRFQADRERTFNQCIDATGNNFANVPAASKVDTDTLAVYIAKAILPKYPGDTLSVGQSTGDAADYGSHGLFGFHYDYAAGWKVSAERQAGTGNICRLYGHANGSANANGWVFGNSLSLLDAATNLRVREDAGKLYHFDSHLRIFGNDLYSPITQDQSNDIMQPYDQNVDKTLLAPNFEQTFGILGHGVNVGVQAELHAGFNLHAEANAPKGCDPSNLAYDVKASVKPYLRATAKPYADIDAVVIKAGVEGTLLLAEVSVPVKAEATLTGQQTTISLNFATSAALDIDALDGSVDLYGQLCLPWVGCTDRATKNIYKWDGLHFEAPIWEFNYSVPLITFDQATKPATTIGGGILVGQVGQLQMSQL